MQTLISVFKDRSAAQRALERLVQSGFAREDLHLQEGSGALAPTNAGTADTTAADTGTADAGTREPPVHRTLTGSTAGDAELGDRTMASAEREVAVDKGVVDMLANFFVGLFGESGHHHARRYSKAVGEGCTMVIVDARTDQEAEHAAVILHDMGATDVDDHHHAAQGMEAMEAVDEVRRPRAGVHVYDRDRQPTLRDLVDHRHIRSESILADRTGQAPAAGRESGGSSASAGAGLNKELPP